MKLTLEEQERAAYISGDTARAALLAAAADTETAQIEAYELNEELVEEADRLRSKIAAARVALGP